MRILSIIILFILAGCSSLPKDKLVKNIRAHVHNEYKISHGELLAKYNLVGFSGENTCLFAKNYGEIVGVEGVNKKFIEYLPQGLKTSHLPNHKAIKQIENIYSKLSIINEKYKIISKMQLLYLKNLAAHIIPSNKSAFDMIEDNSHSKYLDAIAKADSIINDIPSFIPMTEPFLTSKFGNRGKKFHAGIDLASKKHASIYASANGVVAEIASSPSYGNYILIMHKKNIKTRYAHLSKLYVKRGERIFQGQLIGKQGSTGRSTNDHLHFEIIFKNQPIDPLIFAGNEYSCRQKL